MPNNRISNSCRYYLRFLRMDAFGAFRNREQGPFTPGLNVVYGANESGKTTLAKFIGGVLFGWDDARGGKNSYRPKGASQSGSLVFESLDNSHQTIICSRARNADGLVQSEPAEIIGDMDKEAYSTVFSLNSDELRGMGDAEMLIDHLLTAGSGTLASPAQASAQVDDKIKACFSKAASKPCSIPNLKGELSQVRAQIAQAEAESERLACCDAEAHELEKSIPMLQQSIVSSNDRMESLAGAYDALVRLDTQEQEAVLQESSFVQDNHLSHSSGHVHEVGSPAHGDTELHSAAPDESYKQSGSNFEGKGSLFKLALGGFVLFCLIGLILLVFACMRSQLVMAVGSAASFLAAACLGMAAILLPRSSDSSKRTRDFEDQKPTWQEAPPTNIPAHSIDDTSALQAKAVQKEALNARLRQIAYDRNEICAEWGIDCQDAAHQINQRMRCESRSRDSLQQRLFIANQRSGELRQILSAARGSTNLESLRMQEQMLQVQLQEACKDYAMLILARQALADALDAWECSSQPKVFQQASRLMAIMTNGAWQGVQSGGAAGIEVLDYAGVPRSTRELSLGTCQQLYLALRIALLMVAGGAGANLPVLADDILVNFDDERREAAVRALLELAKTRQVIMFTCHSNVVELVRTASEDVNVLHL